MYPSGYSALAGRSSEPAGGYGLSWWDRLVVLVASLVVVLGGLGILVVGLFGSAAGTVAGWWALMALDPRTRLLAAAGGAALALLGAAALRPAVARAGGERAIVRSTGLGEVHISVRAIQTLARRAASQVRGIREAEVHVRPTASGDVNVWVQLTVLPDESIPELCDEVQARVDQYLRQTAGVSCGRITVWVRGVAREARVPRYE